MQMNHTTISIHTLPSATSTERQQLEFNMANQYSTERVVYNLHDGETHWYFMGYQHKHPPHISLGFMLLSRTILLSSMG